tara:strand:- start:437 stop:1264 length:828 start_codon:yes stop_codon:yes gene_type:complete
MKENNSFISFSNKKAGLIFDDSKHDKYPIRYYNVINGKGAEIKENHSYYGYIYDGLVTINVSEHKNYNSYNLLDGMFFSLKDNFRIKKDEVGKLVLIEVVNEAGIYPETKFQAYNTFGGPVEKSGRLKYIDGCTDSLLIPPIKLGNPCLNHLHFPRYITQTQHTHPSHRIGIVSKGNGLCVTPFGNLPLTKGMIFVIKEWDGKSYARALDGKMHPVGEHAFNTTAETLDVIAFHPDSDFGATDVEHPMINRTYVDGVSAKNIQDIQTNDKQFNNQ